MTFIPRNDNRICFIDCGRLDCGRLDCICKSGRNFTYIDAEKIVKDAFKDIEKPKERKVIAITGCKTFGSIEMGKYCGMPDCDNCKRNSELMLKLMQEEVEKQMKDLEMKTILEKVEAECSRQDEKWGIRNMHPASWFLILNEEIGESAQEVNDADHDTNKIDLEKYETELIQSAAVIIQMIKNIQHYGK